MNREQRAQRFEAAGWKFLVARDTETMVEFPELLGLLQECFTRGWLDLEASTPVLQELLQAQERRDYLLVADILEILIPKSLRGPSAH